MKENKTLEKMLETIAEVFSESTSCFGLYEPKVPEKLVEGHLKKVKIFEGQMKRPTFRIKFKGNNPNYGANIAYYYNGK